MDADELDELVKSAIPAWDARTERFWWKEAVGIYEVVDIASAVPSDVFQSVPDAAKGYSTFADATAALAKAVEAYKARQANGGS